MTSNERGKRKNVELQNEVATDNEWIMEAGVGQQETNSVDRLIAGGWKRVVARVFWHSSDGMLTASRKSTPRATGPTTFHVRNDPEIAEEPSLDATEIEGNCEWS